MSTKLYLAAAIAAAAALIPAGVAHATPAHYTDGTQCDGGPFCTLPSAPPPLAPHFGADCATDVIDPPSFVYVTEHFVYGTTPPPAGVTPVHDDAAAVFNYVGSTPGTFTVDIAAEVAGKQGFRADTWNIGTGVTAWVAFDCTPPPTTSTSSTTTMPQPSPTTFCAIPEGCATTSTTSTTVASSGSTTVPTSSTSIEIGTPITATPGAQLPFTGGDSMPLGAAGFGLVCAGTAALALADTARLRRRSRRSS